MGFRGLPYWLKCAIVILAILAISHISGFFISNGSSLYYAMEAIAFVFLIFGAFVIKSWETQPYWKRGGLIGLAICFFLVWLLVFALTWLMNAGGCSCSFERCEGHCFGLEKQIHSFFLNSSLIFLVSLCVIIPVFGAGGAIIGWIYGRKKGKH